MRLLLSTLLLAALALPASANNLNSKDVFFDFSATRGQNEVPDLDTQRPQSLRAAQLPLPDLRKLRLVGAHRVTLAGDRGREELALTLLFGNNTQFFLRMTDGTRFGGRFARLGRSHRKLGLTLSGQQGLRFVRLAVDNVLGGADLRGFRLVRNVQLVAKINRDGDRVKLHGLVPFTAVRNGETVQGLLKLRVVVELD